jgi:hypothetical protein
MASEADHIAVANRTQKTIVHLLQDSETHSPWVAITAFYKALHVVEAVFANDRKIGHTSDHTQREARLKSIRKYSNIVQHYLPLNRASLNARYLSGGQAFDDYMDSETVINRLLKHHLAQVEQTSQKFLSGEYSLDPINSAFHVNP